MGDRKGGGGGRDKRGPVGAAAVEESGTVPAAPASAPISVGEAEREIGTAYLTVSGGRENVRVQIADIRDRLSHIPRDVLDEALMNLAASGRASLFQNDNPGQVTERHKAAALRLPSGSPRHIIYMGGRHG